MPDIPEDVTLQLQRTEFLSSKVRTLCSLFSAITLVSLRVIFLSGHIHDPSKLKLMLHNVEWRTY